MSLIPAGSWTALKAFGLIIICKSGKKTANEAISQQPLRIPNREAFNNLSFVSRVYR